MHNGTSEYTPAPPCISHSLVVLCFMQTSKVLKTVMMMRRNTVAPATSTQMTTEVSIPEPGREGGEIGSLQDEGLYI